MEGLWWIKLRFICIWRNTNSQAWAFHSGEMMKGLGYKSRNSVEKAMSTLGRTWEWDRFLSLTFPALLHTPISRQGKPFIRMKLRMMQGNRRKRERKNLQAVFWISYAHFFGAVVLEGLWEENNETELLYLKDAFQNLGTILTQYVVKCFPHWSQSVGNIQWWRIYRVQHK